MRRLTGFLLAACRAGLTACGGNGGVLSESEALTELNALNKRIKVEEVKSPVLDIYQDELSEADALADISTFPLTVLGRGQIKNRGCSCNGNELRCSG